MPSRSRSAPLLLAGALSACGAEPARPPAPVPNVEPSAGADAGPRDVSTLPTASARAPATLAVLPPPPPPAPPPPAPPPPPHPTTALTESEGNAWCGAPPGKRVPFEESSGSSHEGTYEGLGGVVTETETARIVHVDAGEHPGAGVAWAVETTKEIVLGVRLPEYCGGMAPPLVSLRVTLPAGTKPIRAVLCSTAPCNFGRGPRPP